MLTSYDVWTSDLERVSAIVLRSMRGPILVLIAAAAITILGMVLVPGPEVNGETTRMGFFHAVYFLSYTATTTGFGEIPYEFSNAQRLWAVVSLFISVIAWVYAVGSIITLFQNAQFRRAVAQRQFSKSVRRISDPFCIICGFGDTGSLLTRGLSDAGFTVAIIDIDPTRIQALTLRDYPVTMPGLTADAGVPRHLIAAGLQQPNCRAVIALTNDEGINRKIVIMARLVNPAVQTVCRLTSEVEEEFLESTGPVQVVDAFETFAEQISTALKRPSLRNLGEWLVGARGVSLDNPVRPPGGRWILCGYGRMGRRLHSALKALGVPTVVIDPRGGEMQNVEHKVIGHANARTLREAGIEHAVGVVAATNSDSNNLGILLAARSLHPRIFLIVRQNRHDDEVAFQAADADLIMQPSLVMARRILFLIVAPLVQHFLDYLADVKIRVLVDTVNRLRDAVGNDRPEVWTVIIPEAAVSVSAAMEEAGLRMKLGDFVRDPNQRDRAIGVALVLKRWKQVTVLPKDSEVLHAGDEILFCGTRAAHTQLSRVMRDPFEREFLVTGVEPPRGHIVGWISRSAHGTAVFRKQSAPVRGGNTR